MNDTGFKDTATCQENHDRFVRRIVETETIWALSDENGYAYAESNEDGDPADVILFWSEKAYAKRAKLSNYPEYKETTITLFNFLFRWLPGMSSDGVLAGTNWTGDLVGLEFDSYELRREIETTLSPEQSHRFKQQYNELTKERK